MGSLPAGGPSTPPAQGKRRRPPPCRKPALSHTRGRPQLSADTGGPPMAAPEFDDATRTALEAAAFRKLVEHLRSRADVQNIDMMNLAGFCRNCLSRWYREGAAEQGITLADPDAREIVYGMPYKEWQAKFQKEASAEQKAKFA